MKWIPIFVVPQCSHRYEDAATLALTGKHLIGSFDFNVPGIVFFSKTKCASVMIVLKNMPECKAECSKAVGTVRGIDVQQLDLWLGGVIKMVWGGHGL